MLERFSIRWRLALISSALTFLVLCAFAIVIGQLTTSRVRANFGNETANAASRLAASLQVAYRPDQGAQYRVLPDVDLYAASNDAEIRLFDTQRRPIDSTKGAPDLGVPVRSGSGEIDGYLVVTRFAAAPINSQADNPQAIRFPIWLEYARPLGQVKATVRRVRLFLAVGVFGGTLLALLGALALARRSLRPVTDLTATARDIARTGDPDRHVPQPRNDDEVAELARTFEEMLGALEHSRRETEGALERQRAFAADASHELRTPLTSVLANLELLAEDLQGEQRETAEAALRSSLRMRRLVADLLLLARSDAGQEQAHAELDLAEVARHAVGEAEALSPGRALSVGADAPVIVDGVRDDLHRVVLNLVENAVRHTPEGTQVRVTVEAEGEQAVLTVEDDGPGVPEELQATIFERFVRSGGDRAGSTGLGLAIVRAVAVAHGGEVTLEDAAPGARFVVRLPLAGVGAPPPVPADAAAPGA